MSGGHGPATALQPGDNLGKYSIVREIGRGGMGSVYEARHLDLHKAVAIKTLKPEYAAQPAVVERFLREGRAAARVRHRHAIEMFDVGEVEGMVYLAMELLDGEDFAAKLKREGALSAQTTVDLLLPVLSAIDEAHEAGIVHRDLKPANIFLATSRRGHVEPKVLDFGISRLDDDQGQTATDALLGTPLYMAPEQVRGAKNTSALSDQFSLGVILYQCLTGGLPFRGSSSFETMQRITLGVYTRPCDLRPELDAALESVIVRAMASDPAARFPSVAALALALCPFASVGVRSLWEPTFSHAGHVAPASPSPLVVTPTLPMRDAGTITAANGSISVEVPTIVTGQGRVARRGFLVGIALLGVLALGVGSWLGARIHDRQGPRTAASTQPHTAVTQPVTPQGASAALATPTPAMPPPPVAVVEVPTASVPPPNEARPSARLRNRNTRIGQRSRRGPSAPAGTTTTPVQTSTTERDRNGAMIVD